MKKAIGVFGFIATCLLAPNIHAITTDAQIISNIKIDNNGRIYVYTSDNAGLWLGGCSGMRTMEIASNAVPKNNWLSLILMAKASGRAVAFSYSTCTNFVVTEVNSQ